MGESTQGKLISYHTSETALGYEAQSSEFESIDLYARAYSIRPSLSIARLYQLAENSAVIEERVMLNYYPPDVQGHPLDREDAQKIVRNNPDDPYFAGLGRSGDLEDILALLCGISFHAYLGRNFPHTISTTEVMIKGPSQSFGDRRAVQLHGLSGWHKIATL